ncbi:hypothetical protein B0H13DRAFT_1972094 [Mycena leptocephala]|nr:hypothetical protein B0H13DRAFT_1972094 [Mycena leptocephala]
MQYFEELPSFWCLGRCLDCGLDSWNADDNIALDTVLLRLICKPFERIEKRLVSRMTLHSSTGESTLSPQLAPILLIVHGVRSIGQVDELFLFIEMINAHVDGINIVVITDPSLFHHVAAHRESVLKQTYTLNVTDSGSVIYSGERLVAPTFYNGLLALALEGIHLFPGPEAGRSGAG